MCFIIPHEDGDTYTLEDQENEKVEIAAYEEENVSHEAQNSNSKFQIPNSSQNKRSSVLGIRDWGLGILSIISL
jgi:hypothetical protein